MKQILQNLKNGKVEVVDVPCPQIKFGHLLIRTTASLVSAGTERMLLEFGQGSILQKVRQQPDKVKMILDKIKSDGLLPTLDAVNSKLDKPLPMGYCNVGEVLEVGPDVHGFKIGDRVLSNGNHAEVVLVSKNLCMHIPDEVDDEEAVFGVLGAIALQGTRLAKPELGETVAVIGLGLIGLLLVQLLKAQGCRVLGIDFDEQKLNLAKQYGAEIVNLNKNADPVASAMQFSRNRGVDAVLIAASSKENEIIHQAAQMSRKRGRIVLVGVVGLKLLRADFYEKELSFQVSCSYGPGRYDLAYEEHGNDYPFAYVRWTEQRNFEAVLDMMANGAIDTGSLISHRFSLSYAEKAYQLLTDNKAEALGIVLKYVVQEKRILQDHSVTIASYVPTEDVTVGFIGAGNYATRVLIPAFKKTGAELFKIASSGGLNATYAARKYGFVESTSKVSSILEDPGINAVVIATRHNSHADLVCNALLNNKKVFVEKPLAINREQLNKINSIYTKSKQPFLMIGFNRRFAPQIKKIKELLMNISEPKAFIMTVNAGFIPQNNWVQDIKVGGGRIVGEACHMIDLLRFLADAKIDNIKAMAVGRHTDQVSITFTFTNGSLGTIHYLANGHKSFPKERLEVFCGGRVLQLDNFRKLKAYGWPGFRGMNLWKQNKGNEACVQATVNAIINGYAAPIDFVEIIETTEASLKVVDQIFC